MKNILPILFGAALLPLAANADPAYSNVGGYTTQSLLSGKFNLIGLNLQNPVVVAGALEAVSVDGLTLTDNDVADFTTVLPQNANNNALYILEITSTSGAAVGATQEFTVRAGSTITLPASVGAVVGDTYQIRIAPTLEQIFGTTTSVLQKGVVIGGADVVWIPNGVGGYNRFWLNTGSSFRNSAGAAAPTTPVVYLDGVLVEKRATSANNSLVVTGEVKTVGSTNAIIKGFNPVGTIYPAGSTLQNLGLEDDLFKAVVIGSADVVWIPDGAGGYARYWLNTSGSWRTSAGGAAPADIPLTAAVFIEKKNVGTVTLDLTAPSFYATL